MTDKPITDPVVWTEIPVTDLEAARKFYNTVLATQLRDMEMGPNKTLIFPADDPETAVAGHLYEGRPAAPGTGSTIHLALRDAVENGMERVEQAGGKVVSDVIEIPAGRFAYCLDPDGNSIGLFSR